MTVRNIPDYIRARSKVDPATGCWVWSGTRVRRGYGYANLKGQPRLAHRLAYTALVGPIPTGLIIMHECDNPPCVNPDHLSAGTKKQNAQDMVRKGRQFQPKPAGEPYCR